MSTASQPATGPARPIVVGFNPTPEGHAAFEAALVHARQWGTSVVVVNSAHGGAVTDSHVADDAALEDLRARADEAGTAVEVHQLPTSNDPVEAVIDVVERYHAQMLVIGLRRRSPVGKFLLGSSAQSLLQRSPVPVLSVKSS